MSSALQRCSQKASASVSGAHIHCNHSRRFQQSRCSRLAHFRVHANENGDKLPSASESQGKPQLPEPSTSGSQIPESPANPDDTLRPLFEKSKRDMINALGLSKEEADMVQRMTYEDLDDVDGFVRKLADETLGPILDALNVEEDPITFFKDLFIMATALQLGTCLVTYYSAHLGLHMETGEALRITSGLFIGLLTRPLLQVEQFLWPLYDAVVKLLSDQAAYEVPRATPAQMQQALNVIAFVTAAVFLVPQALFLWTPKEALELVLPMAGGWIAFDLCYSIAILVKCRML